ncbi:VWA domain-containing protein [Vallitaleaceae bacterium 9-2]
MHVNITTLAPLLLLIPIGGVMAMTYYKRHKYTKRLKTLWWMRVISLLLIVMSLCGMTIVRSAKQEGTIFLVDRSQSMTQHAHTMETFIHEALKEKPDEDLVGIVAFGNESKIENTLRDRIEFNGFQVQVDDTFTNIYQGLIQSQVVFDPNIRKRIVLMSDGYENNNQADKQLRALAEAGIQVDVVSYERVGQKEVQVDEILLPKNAEKNQQIQVEVSILSTDTMTVDMQVYVNGKLSSTQSVDLKPGENKYTFFDEMDASGLVDYTVEVVPKEDTYIENNKRSAYVIVNDLANILLVQDEHKEGENYIRLLNESAHIESVMPMEVPLELDNLLKYDAFILADISLETLSPTFIEHLELLVRNQGKGLLVSGGDNSYGLGGYYNTVLEEMLPVQMDVKSKEEKPNLGMVLVIDKSGSMSAGQYGVSQMELAKEAAIRSTEILEEQDYLGVIAFDGEFKWVVKPALMEEKEKMQDAIATLVPGGGTSIRPALNAAVDALMPLDTALKHIILLTDGQAENTGYETILDNISEEEITLSTVAVGSGADNRLLYNLAEAGGGRYYATDVFTDIPSIFTKEAFMAGKKYLNNVSFYPEVTNYSSILDGISGLPMLDGYVATREKNMAKVVLSSPDNDPILATWQYGLGRTMAWTSDMNGMWTSQWLNWPQNKTLWANSMAWLVQQQINQDYSVQTEYVNGEGKIVVEQTDGGINQTTELKGELTNPSGKTEQITLKATAPGVYEGIFKPQGEGVYLANIGLEDEQGAEQILAGVIVPYSPEFDFFAQRRLTPESIIQQSGGRIITSPSNVFEGELPPVNSSQDISTYLLVLGMLVFLTELFFRKVR